MTGSEGLTELPLAAFARAVAASGPVPGSGSTAAAVGALGAGLASMALGSARDDPEAARVAAALAGTMEALLASVSEDARAYAAFLEARAGRGDLAAAVEGSIRVPEEVATRALEALEHLARTLSSVRPRLRSEAVTAAHALRACVLGAAFTAGANLPGLSDEHAREPRRARLDALAARARRAAAALDERLGIPTGGSLAP